MIVIEPKLLNAKLISFFVHVNCKLIFVVNNLVEKLKLSAKWK